MRLLPLGEFILPFFLSVQSHFLPNSYRQAVFEIDLMRRLTDIRAPVCEDHDCKVIGKSSSSGEDEYRFRVVMGKLPGEPLDNWVDRARRSVRSSPREGR